MPKAHPHPSIRTALVTGAASGIGAAAVTRMRNQGIRIIAADRNPDLEAIYQDDDQVVAVVGDMADPEYSDELVARAHDKFGSIDRLFHSAGIMLGGLISDNDVDAILDVMKVNYEGTVRITKAVLPHMQARRTGQIICLGSIGGYVPGARLAAYCASKAAVHSYVETLAHEEAPNGIRVLLAAPNAVKTPLLAQALDGPKLIEKFHTSDQAPMMTTPDKVLDAIEHALDRNRTVVLPKSRSIYAMRRLSPRFAWWSSQTFG